MIDLEPISDIDILTQFGRYRGFIDGIPGTYGPFTVHEDGTISCKPVRVPFQIVEVRR